MSTANEPAYPQPMTLCKDGSGFEWPDNGWGIGGLTKREVIAMHALAGWISDQSMRNSPEHIRNATTFAVACADALLAELERTEKT